MKKILLCAVLSVGAFTVSAQAEIYQSFVPHATAECMDGTYTDSTGSGACSGHGGIARRLTPTLGKVSGKRERTLDGLRRGATIKDVNNGDYRETDAQRAAFEAQSGSAPATRSANSPTSTQSTSVTPEYSQAESTQTISSVEENAP